MSIHQAPDRRKHYWKLSTEHLSMRIFVSTRKTGNSLSQSIVVLNEMTLDTKVINSTDVHSRDEEWLMIKSTRYSIMWTKVLWGRNWRLRSNNHIRILSTNRSPHQPCCQFSSWWTRSMKWLTQVAVWKLWCSMLRSKVSMIRWNEKWRQDLSNKLRCETSESKTLSSSGRR